MFSFRGCLRLVSAASICWISPALQSAELYREVAPDAQARAHVAALFYYGTTQERALEREGALAAFSKLLELDPANTEVAMRAAKLAASTGDRVRGRRIIDASLAANPDKAEPYLNLARYLDLFQPPGGELAFAARALQVAGLGEEKFPADPRVCALLIDLLLQGRDVTNAAETIRRFAARDGGTAYWLGIATDAKRVIDHDGGEDAISRAEVDALYEKTLLNSRGNPAVADAVANYYISADNYERALEVLEPLVKAQPELGLEREKLARIYRIQGKHEQALAEIRALVSAYPNEPRTQRLLADLLAEQNDYEGAVVHRARAIQLGGAEAEDYVELASQLADEFEPPRYEEALRWLARGLSASPVSPRLHYMRGIILGNMERFAEAATSYAQAERTAAVTAPTMLDSDFYYKWGSAADRAGEREEAARHYTRSIDLVPADQPDLAARALNNFAYMLLLEGIEVDTAGEMARRAVELEPRNPVYLDTLGWFYYKKALFRKALVELRRARQLMGDETDPDIEAHIEAVKDALGE